MNDQNLIFKTSQWVCMARAISYLENNEYLKCDDNLSSVFVPEIDKVRKIFKDMISKKFIPKGGYEYVIARTKFIDEVFRNLDDSIKQVIVIGSGFDTRSIRFKDELKNIKIYELDLDVTQDTKLKRFKEMNVEIPENLNYVKIDFINESINKIENSGFERNKKNIYIIEGVLMYLNSDTVQKIFSYIRDNSANESIIVFDYVTKEFLNNSEMNILISKSGEECNFTIENTNLKSFLKNYNLEILDICNENKLEERYFSDKKGNKKINIVGYHGSIVTTKLIK